MSGEAWGLLAYVILFGLLGWLSWPYGKGKGDSE